MSGMKNWLMDVSYAVGENGDLDGPRLPTAVALLNAERATWEVLDHLTERDLPAEVWNEAVSAIDECRAAQEVMGIRHLGFSWANFRHQPTVEAGV